jgi:hypothetical protein
VSQLLSRLVPVRVTVAYAVALAVVGITLLALGHDTHSSVVSHMSTNLSNLAHGHLGTLIGSAFVTEDDDIYVWLPGLACLLAVGELLWCGRGLLFAFGLGHIGATLIVAVGLALAVAADWLPRSIEYSSDVGISYGAAGVLGALTAAIPARSRPAWVGWWLAVGLTIAAADDWDFTAVGHVLALLLGMLASLRFRAHGHWTATRVVLFVAGVSFCYLLLAGSSLHAPAAGLAAASIAVTGQWVAQRLSGARRKVVEPGIGHQLEELAVGVTDHRRVLCD